MNALEGAYQRKIRAAREAHLIAIERLTPEEQEAFIEAREPTEPAAEFDEARVKCPACGNIGLLQGEPEPDWEADWDTEGGEAYVAGAYVSSVRLFTKGFTCGVCELRLDADQLALADLATVDLTDDDADLESATEYFTRQLAEDAWDDY